MSERIPDLLVQDIIDSCNKILEYTNTLSFDDFCKDGKTIDAVIRNFESIGEAANRLPDDFKERCDDIDWHRIRGFRNRIVHHYFGIDYSIVWEIRNNFLQDFIIKLREIKY